MSIKQYPLDKAFLVAAWFEALVYGFYFCLFCVSLRVNLTMRRVQDHHSRTMFYIGIMMFIIATMHLGMNCYRMIQGFIVHVNEPGGAASFIGNLPPWDHIFKDTLYATQEIFGDGVAIYRAWIIWNRDWRVIVLPVMLFIASCVSGYAVCGLYSTVDPTASVFSPTLTKWIKIFYSVAVIQSSLTTGLISYKIWTSDRRTARYRAAGSTLLPVLRILLESAALLVLVETLLLSLYLVDYNAQYILLEITASVVGITFTAITIRIFMRGSSTYGLSDSRPSEHEVRGPLRQAFTSTHMLPARDMTLPLQRIAINVTHDMEQTTDPSDSASEHTTKHLKSEIP